MAKSLSNLKKLPQPVRKSLGETQPTPAAQPRRKKKKLRDAWKKPAPVRVPWPKPSGTRQKDGTYVIPYVEQPDHPAFPMLRFRGDVRPEDTVIVADFKNERIVQYTTTFERDGKTNVVGWTLPGHGDVPKYLIEWWPKRSIVDDDPEPEEEPKPKRARKKLHNGPATRLTSKRKTIG